MSPWVRLHALRGYRDLCADIVRDEVPCTVNVVPSLLDQLDWYANGGDDPHAELVARSADVLAPPEIAEIRSTFVAGNHAMIAASPHWARLAARVRGGDLLDIADLRDVQVWSVLAWFGSTARRDFPVLDALRAKGMGFSEDDKHAMIAVTRAIFAEYPKRFADVAKVGSLSTSPYFHPILPLLVNTAHARRCLPHLSDEDDAGFAFPDDARLQCARARERVGKITGTPPIGLWPSEGSVSPEVVEIAASVGFRWLCSDEGVLARSDGDRATRAGGWDLGHGMTGFFRDHELSDRIGFDAPRHPPGPFANTLVKDALARSRGGTTVIALDGENPWEAHADAGHAFREAFHRALRGHAITLDDASKEPSVGRVRRLHTGSWIRADFGIWYGHEDDRRAWRLLADVRKAIAAAPPERRAAALERVLPAEGSDWTWWYGDDFDTPFLAAFDAAFRSHLRAAWQALGKEPPAVLDRPVSERVLGAADADVTLPRLHVTARLESDPSWARWIGAGRLVPRRGSAMAHGEPVVEDVYFGLDDEDACWLWLRFTGPRPAGESWHLEVDERPIDIAIGELQPDAIARPHAIVVRVRDHTARLQLVVEGGGVRVPAHGSANLPIHQLPAHGVGWLV